MQICVCIYFDILANVPIWIRINTCIYMQTQDTKDMYTIVSIGYKGLNYKASQKVSSILNSPLGISSKTAIKKLVDLPASFSKLQANNC